MNVLSRKLKGKAESNLIRHTQNNIHSAMPPDKQNEFMQNRLKGKSDAHANRGIDVP